MTILRWVIGLIGAGLAWLAWELVGELAGEAISITAAPVTRPVWRVFVNASWPWPSLVLLLVGGALARLGWRQHGLALETWRGGVGLGAFFGGWILMILAPLSWIESRRQREDM